jgi:hypothetical protein
MIDHANIDTGRADYLYAVLKTLRTLKSEADRRGLADVAALCERAITEGQAALAKVAN